MTMTKRVIDLPEHDEVVLQLSWLALDDWREGDGVLVGVSGVHFGPFDQYSDAEPIENACGLQHRPDSYREVAIPLLHSFDVLDITIRAKLSLPVYLASFALVYAELEVRHRGQTVGQLPLFRPASALDDPDEPLFDGIGPRHLSTCPVPLFFGAAFDTFSNGTNGWTGASANTCGSLGKILGGYPSFASGTLTRVLSSLPEHDNVQVSLDVYAIDDWNASDHYFVNIDSLQFGPYDKNTGAQQLGQACGLPMDAVGSPPSAGSDTKRSLCFTLPHTARNVTVSITSFVDQHLSPGLCCSFLGIDNVDIRLDPTTTATPSPTASVSPTISETASGTATGSQTSSETASHTPSVSSAVSLSHSATVTASPTSSTSSSTSSTSSHSLSAAPSSSLSPSVTTSPSLSPNINPVIISPSSNATLLSCVTKPHPWKHDTSQKGYGIGIATAVSAFIGAMFVLHSWRQLCHSRSVSQRLSDALGVLSAADPRRVKKGPSLLFMWALVDVLFRTAPFSWSDVPWDQRGSELEGARAVFFMFLVRPATWWLLMMGMVLVYGAVILFVLSDRAVIKYATNESASVLPVGVSMSPRKAVDAGVSQTVRGWLVLGTGRLMAGGPLLLPAVYILLTPWVCPSQGVQRTAGGVDEVYSYATSECGPGSVLRCYGFWHWVYLAASLIGLGGLMWCYAPLSIPTSLKPAFGLPHFEVVTVPLRMLLGWSARVLVYFSVCWSLWLSLLCNMALLGALVLYLRSGRCDVSMWLKVLLVVCGVWCVVAGLGSLGVYYGVGLGGGGGSVCGVAIGVCVFASVLLLLMFAAAWMYGTSSGRERAVNDALASPVKAFAVPVSLTSVVPSHREPIKVVGEEKGYETDTQSQTTSYVGGLTGGFVGGDDDRLTYLSEDMRQAVATVTRLDNRLRALDSPQRNSASRGVQTHTPGMSIEQELREGEIVSRAVEAHTTAVVAYHDATSPHFGARRPVSEARLPSAFH